MRERERDEMQKENKDIKRSTQKPTVKQIDNNNKYVSPVVVE